MPDKPLQDQEEIKITNTELAEKMTTRDCPNGATVSADIAGRQWDTVEGIRIISGGRVFVQDMENHSLWDFCYMCHI